MTSPSSEGSCLDEDAIGTGRDGGWGRDEEEEEDVRGFLVYCGSESGSCRRFAGGAGEDSREAGGEGGSSEGSGWLCGPRIYGKRVNDDRTEGRGRADFKTLQELFSGERTVEDCVRRTSTRRWERGWGIPSP